MRYLITLALLTLYNMVFSQPSLLIPDTSIAIPAVYFDAGGDLIVKASPASSSKDFDFLIGNWKLKNRKLRSRLTRDTVWTAFESKVTMYPILGGMGNIDRYSDIASGKPYEGIALRLFNAKTKCWSIYWADSIAGTLDPPVVGSFENNIGHFFCKDTFNGKKIIVVFRWDVRNPNLPVWSQAFSTDNGKTWEWNSINVSERTR